MRQSILSFAFLATVMIASSSALGGLAGLANKDGGNDGIDLGLVNKDGGNDGIDLGLYKVDDEEFVGLDFLGLRRRSFLARKKQGHSIYQRRRSEADEEEEDKEDEEEEELARRSEDINDVPNSGNPSAQEGTGERQNYLVFKKIDSDLMVKEDINNGLEGDFDGAGVAR